MGLDRLGFITRHKIRRYGSVETNLMRKGEETDPLRIKKRCRIELTVEETFRKELKVTRLK